jgi:SRSO17 transposase
MDHRPADDSESRFAAYVEGLVSVIGHADRARPLRDYCMGLMMPCERKSVEPMAAVTAPARVAAQHQSLLHFVGEGRWSDEKVLAKVRAMVLPAIQQHGPVEAWIIDDTGFPKQGRHSVGVARQYCGQLGKEDNCQVAVSLSLANGHASLPVAYRLYLPQEWAMDRERLRKTGVPEDIAFMTKHEIALEQLHWACEAGLPRGVVLMDAGYGNNSDLRADITALELTYVAGIQSNTTVWPPGTGPLSAKKWSGRGRPPKLLRRDAKHQPVSVKELALGLPKSAWRTIKWREGTAEPLSSRFARVRVRVARRDFKLAESRPEEWLLIEWPEGEGTDQILALDPSQRHHLPSLGGPRQAALAHRTGLSRTQAGGRARTFRRPRLAWLSSPRHPVHRSLRFPDLRAGDDSPLRTSFRQGAPGVCHFRWLPTQRLRRCGPNGTSRIRSPRCADG